MSEVTTAQQLGKHKSLLHVLEPYIFDSPDVAGGPEYKWRGQHPPFFNKRKTNDTYAIV